MADNCGISLFTGFFPWQFSSELELHTSRTGTDRYCPWKKWEQRAGRIYLHSWKSSHCCSFVSISSASGHCERRKKVINWAMSFWKAPLAFPYCCSTRQLGLEQSGSGQNLAAPEEGSPWLALWDIELSCLLGSPFWSDRKCLTTIDIEYEKCIYFYIISHEGNNCELKNFSKFVSELYLFLWLFASLPITVHCCY